MTRRDLLDALVGRLKGEFLGYSLPNKNGVMQQLNVYAQWLPQGKGINFDTRDKYGLKSYEEDDYNENFPCIICRIGDMTDTEENKLTASLVNVKLITGIYDAAPECQGYRDLMDIQERIRQMLLEQRILAGQYILRMPLTTKMLDADTWPVWFGEQELVYTLGRPVRDWEYIHGGMRPPMPPMMR